MWKYNSVWQSLWVLRLKKFDKLFSNMKTPIGKYLYIQEWKKRNPDKVRQARRNWYLKNKDKQREYYRKWKKSHPNDNSRSYSSYKKFLL